MPADGQTKPRHHKELLVWQSLAEPATSSLTMSSHLPHRPISQPFNPANDRLIPTPTVHCKYLNLSYTPMLLSPVFAAQNSPAPPSFVFLPPLLSAPPDTHLNPLESHSSASLAPQVPWNDILTQNRGGRGVPFITPLPTVPALFSATIPVRSRTESVVYAGSLASPRRVSCSIPGSVPTLPCSFSAPSLISRRSCRWSEVAHGKF